MESSTAVTVLSVVLILSSVSYYVLFRRVVKRHSKLVTQLSTLLTANHRHIDKLQLEAVQTDKLHRLVVQELRDDIIELRDARFGDEVRINAMKQQIKHQ